MRYRYRWVGEICVVDGVFRGWCLSCLSLLSLGTF